MLYLSYDEYTSFCGEIPAGEYAMLAHDAQKAVDDHTTGVDGFRKLREAFPTNEDDVMAVKICMARLVDFLWKVDIAERSRSLSERSDGTVAGRVLASVSSGSESMTFATGVLTAADKAAADPMVKREAVRNLVRTELDGAYDANGVRLLYMGVYPCV